VPRVGFAAVVGRPNVGKSTLVNAMVGEKVSITSSRPNTTRWQLRGVVHRPDAQIILVDTPGLHRPRTPLGERLNQSARAAFGDVDVIVAVVDATEAVGPGDRRTLELAIDAASGGGDNLLVVVNKTDRAASGAVLERLAGAAAVVDARARAAGSRAGGVEYYPVSATTGSGVGALVDAVVARLPEGAELYPPDMVRETPEGVWVAELVREQLISHLHDELPHAVACRVTEWEWPHIKCEILVERRSQKGIVIGHRGEVLREVGIAVRAQLPPGAYLELFVRVEPSWQRRADALDRLGI